MLLCQNILFENDILAVAVNNYVMCHPLSGFSNHS